MDAFRDGGSSYTNTLSLETPSPQRQTDRHVYTETHPDWIRTEQSDSLSLEMGIGHDYLKNYVTDVY